MKAFNTVVHFRVELHNDTSSATSSSSSPPPASSTRRASLHLLVDQIKSNEPELFGKLALESTNLLFDSSSFVVQKRTPLPPLESSLGWSVAAAEAMTYVPELPLTDAEVRDDGASTIVDRSSLTLVLVGLFVRFRVFAYIIIDRFWPQLFVCLLALVLSVLLAVGDMSIEHAYHRHALNAAGTYSIFFFFVFACLVRNSIRQPTQTLTNTTTFAITKTETNTNTNECKRNTGDISAAMVDVWPQLHGNRSSGNTFSTMPFVDWEHQALFFILRFFFGLLLYCLFVLSQCMFGIHGGDVSSFALTNEIGYEWTNWSLRFAAHTTNQGAVAGSSEPARSRAALQRTRHRHRHRSSSPSSATTATIAGACRR